MDNQQMSQLYMDVQANKVEIGEFKAAIEIHVQAEIAEQKLSALQWKQRYENANKMAKSYMAEFQSRGLMYAPPLVKFEPVKTQRMYNYQPKPKKD
jgi:hypothetical protein